jgi:hypothetical protein
VPVFFFPRRMTELEIAQQQLTDVRAAITAVLKGGQSYTIFNRQMNRGDLKELRNMERDLLTKVSRLQNGGIRVQRVYPLG